jgi:N-acyl-D-amino-acid deacylase
MLAKRREKTMAKVDLVIRGGTVADGAGSPLREADVAVDGGKIVAVGKIAETGREEVDARGLLVTPGFVDVHTHYDGQLTWSERLNPSSGHGVTTVVTGNCGVGFAPCRPQDRDNLIRLMEGVEDIPELVMAEGLPWDWQSFPEFLDSVERKPHDIDYAVLLPHSPLRVFVMGQRAVDLEPATEADRAQMRVIAKAAMEAGAVGFGTSRNIFHQASDGSYIPSMSAEESELTEIARGLTDAGRGVLQGITITGAPSVGDYEIFHRVSQASGRPASYTLLQAESWGGLWREVMASVERDRAAGVDVKPQVFNRPVGVILGLEASFNPFSMHPFYAENLAKLPLEQRVAEMRKPEVRERLLGPAEFHKHPMANTMRRWEQIYPMGELANYEPDPATSIAAQAAARGVAPEAIAYDLLLEQDGHAKLMVASSNYAQGNLDTTLELMNRDDTVLALGDGGAHYGMICDGSYTTTTLTHWVRDRRGERLDLAEAVRMLTDKPAQLHRFRDRGRIAPGMKGDLNIIDMDKLKLFSPSVIYDLPGGGKRLSQDAEGYKATYVSGVAIQRDGQETGARPGKLVRDAGI